MHEIYVQREGASCTSSSAMHSRAHVDGRRGEYEQEKSSPRHISFAARGPPRYVRLEKWDSLGTLFGNCHSPIGPAERGSEPTKSGERTSGGVVRRARPEISRRRPKDVLEAVPTKVRRVETTEMTVEGQGQQCGAGPRDMPRLRGQAMSSRRAWAMTD